MASLKVTSPHTGEVVAEMPFDAAAGVEQKLDAAVRAQRAWHELTVEDRVAVVRAGMQWFRDHADEVARDITRQMGKPLRQSEREIEAMLARADHMLQIAPAALAPERLPDRPGVTRRIEHAPLGVVLNLSAWNYPLLITVNVVVPALLAGNTLLLKHSARTPLCGGHFAAALGALRPPDLVTQLTLSHAATARLIGDPRVAHVAFTGSVEGGRAVHRAASERFIDTGLELGGVDPAYVAADADLDLAVPGIVDGACYNAGQSCCAVERAYVHRDRYDEFVPRSRSALEALRTGDPMLATTTLGPMAAAAALDHLEAQVADAVGRGARLLCGGSRLPGGFFAPTLLVDCPNDAAVMQEESFGPILPVAAVRDDSEALQRMNDSRFGLTASVWTTDRQRASWFAARLEAGTIYQNRCDALDPALPWTGWKDSGKGSTLSHHGFHHLTRRKSILFHDG